MYERVIKRLFDLLLSAAAMIVMGWLYLLIGLFIKLDDPGPVFFTQKRVGKGKKLFKLHKFRSMKMSTPHDMPTHLLTNPEQYITKVGRFLRKSSLDEIPQVWDIFVGNMSIIGPRPALWNQDDLIAERDRALQIFRPKCGLIERDQPPGIKRTVFELRVKCRVAVPPAG